MVGASRFELPTSCSQGRRARPGCATPRPIHLKKITHNDQRDNLPPVLIHVGSQGISQPSQRFPTVADPVLLVKGELGHRLSVPGDDKNRIVSEPLVSHLAETDSSPARTLQNCFSPARGNNRDRTFEPGPSFRGTNSFQRS
jgi:hypothetical protein